MIGGGVGSNPAVNKRLGELTRPFIFADLARGLPIVPAVLGDNACAIGVAALAYRAGTTATEMKRRASGEKWPISLRPARSSTSRRTSATPHVTRHLWGEARMPASSTTGSTPRPTRSTSSSSACSRGGFVQAYRRVPHHVRRRRGALRSVRHLRPRPIPETGEVQVAKAGEALFFRKDTWHHGFSLGDEPVRVLEYFSPPPSQGTSGPYARTTELDHREPLSAGQVDGPLPDGSRRRKSRPAPSTRCATPTFSGASTARRRAPSPASACAPSI